MYAILAKISVPVSKEIQARIFMNGKQDVCIEMMQQLNIRTRSIFQCQVQRTECVRMN